MKRLAAFLLYHLLIPFHMLRIRRDLRDAVTFVNRTFPEQPTASLPKVSYSRIAKWHAGHDVATRVFKRPINSWTDTHGRTYSYALTWHPRHGLGA